ncbi:MAG: DUF411 domain-containing protein [Gammaproteobacteria bacterium]|nr:DUF411 domain-containing protein [Gammaproteobacteria bacterium]
MFVRSVAVAAVVLLLNSATALSSDNGIAGLVLEVYKTPTCGCCGKWVDHLRDHGFEVKVNEVSNTRAVQDRAGVPRELRSCHTAIVGEYFVEGHTPADVIEQFFTEQPEGVRGIGVPGMPMGSPGMESPNPEVYDIIAVGEDGSLSRYATRQGKAPE